MLLAGTAALRRCYFLALTARTLLLVRSIAWPANEGP